MVTPIPRPMLRLYSESMGVKLPTIRSVRLTVCWLLVWSVCPNFKFHLRPAPNGALVTDFSFLNCWFEYISGLFILRRRNKKKTHSSSSQLIQPRKNNSRPLITTTPPQQPLFLFPVRPRTSEVFVPVAEYWYPCNLSVF